MTLNGHSTPTSPNQQGFFITKLVLVKLMCCVFRPANACLRMSLQGRKQSKTCLDFLEMCLRALVLPVFITKCIREITRGSVMCCYLIANDLIYDRMK